MVMLGVAALEWCSCGTDFFLKKMLRMEELISDTIKSFEEGNDFVNYDIFN